MRQSLFDLLMLFPTAVNHGLEGGQAAADHGVGHAVGKAHIAFAFELFARNHQKVVFHLGFLGEGAAVAVWRFHEEVEGTVRLRTTISHGSERIVQQCPVFVIGCQIRHFVDAPLYDLLQQGRCTDMTVGPGCAGDRVQYIRRICTGIRHADITDTFSRQGQTLGPGIA